LNLEVVELDDEVQLLHLVFSMLDAVLEGQKHLATTSLPVTGLTEIVRVPILFGKLGEEFQAQEGFLADLADKVLA
jgi:hypothetical protein